MIKVRVFYPKAAGSTFDMDYYLSRHIPMVQAKLGPACKGMAVEEGLTGGVPDAPAAYSAMGHMYFDSVEHFQGAFNPPAETILADVPNYTNAQPAIQISEVRV